MNAKEIYDFLMDSGMTSSGACGLMGNLYTESGLKFNALERLCRQRLREAGKGDWTDEAYTAAVGLAEAVMGAGLTGYLSLAKSDHRQGGITYDSAQAKQFKQEDGSQESPGI